MLMRAVRDRFRALCCTEFGNCLTTWVYPGGSMTEQLPSTQVAHPHLLRLAIGQTEEVGRKGKGA